MAYKEKDTKNGQLNGLKPMSEVKRRNGEREDLKQREKH